MFKLNFALLLALIVACNSNVFSMGDPDLGDSTVIIPLTGTNNAGQDGADDQQVPNDPDADDEADQMPTRRDDVPGGDRQSKCFFTKTKLAILGCVGSALSYLIYKYIYDNKAEQAQANEDIL